MQTLPPHDNYPNTNISMYLYKIINLSLNIDHFAFKDVGLYRFAQVGQCVSTCMSVLVSQLVQPKTYKYNSRMIYPIDFKLVTLIHIVMQKIPIAGPRTRPFRTLMPWGA